MRDAWPEFGTDAIQLEQEFGRLIEFGTDVVHPNGGAAYLGADGTPDFERPVYTWITARMVHVYAIAAMRGHATAGIASGALAGLTGALRDDEHGGWFTAVDRDGDPVSDGVKSCYDHAFVLLAASTATLAGVPGARELLAQARTVFAERFLDGDRCVDQWNRDWTVLDDYRGMNSTMHAVEALLATGDVDDASLWHDRALAVASRAAREASAQEWRMPEHFDADWNALLDFNADKPSDPFKPYGATIGHGLEWSRLLLNVEATVGTARAPGFLDAARALFDRAVADGWNVDGAEGFVYTTDWAGVPVVTARMHWVVAEAIAASATLARRTGEARYADLYRLWWDYAQQYVIDDVLGSWHHELDATNLPAAGTWPGKPDIYHAVQATLIPRLPLTPGIAKAVAESALGDRDHRPA